MTYFIIALVLVIIVIIFIYNSLVQKRNQVTNAFSSVDVMLKKRADLIPNLVSTVKGYAKHEQSLLERVTALRTTTQNQTTATVERFQAEADLTSALSKITILREAYPDLKANRQFLQLMAALNEAEEQISAARRAYNASVNDYNNSVDMFPSSVVAAAFRFQRQVLFVASESEKVNVTTV